MMKSVLVIVFLILTLPLISESFSYFDADMIDYNLGKGDYNFNESKIIQFTSEFVYFYKYLLFY